MFKRDPYKKLHRRRRRRRRSRPLAGPLFVVLLLAGAAYGATTFRSLPQTMALSTVAVAPTVALLTARDAVNAARVLAVPPAFEGTAEVAPPAEPPLVSPVEKLAPRDWSSGLELTIEGSLKKNQSLSVALARRGVPQGSIAALVSGLGDGFDFRRCRPGDTFAVDVSTTGAITRFRYQSSPTNIIEAFRSEDGYRVSDVEVPVERRQGAVTGAIESSLWQSFERTGAGGALAAQYVDVFAYTIDFATETQPGDRFGAVYESTWLDGAQLSTGKLAAVRYAGAAGEHWAFRWKDAFYTESGESVERQFLRSPLKTVRVTSRYGRRFHPVLNQMKMHAGVDYGAPIGTPVQAVANGRVTYAGWKGANGKLIAIQHAGGYTTYYAHLSEIGRGIRPGVTVKKKQLIGKVGNTGRSTGPHLHFGMKLNGRYINPLKIDFERGEPLSARERETFLREAVAPLKAKLQQQNP